MLMFGYREKERPWSLNFSTNHHTNQSMFKSEQLCELWVRRHGLSQGIASMKREISKYTEKKNPTERRNMLSRTHGQEETENSIEGKEIYTRR